MGIFHANYGLLLAESRHNGAEIDVREDDVCQPCGRRSWGGNLPFKILKVNEGTQKRHFWEAILASSHSKKPLFFWDVDFGCGCALWIKLFREGGWAQWRGRRPRLPSALAAGNKHVRTFCSPLPRVLQPG